MDHVRSSCNLTVRDRTFRLTGLEKTVCGRLYFSAPNTWSLREARGQLLDLQQYSGERTHRFRKQVKPELSGEVCRPTGQLAGHPVGRYRFKNPCNPRLVLPDIHGI